MNECKPLTVGFIETPPLSTAQMATGMAPDQRLSVRVFDTGIRHAGPGTRGLHSFTFQLNWRALYEIGGARRGCVARVKGC